MTSYIIFLCNSQYSMVVVVVVVHVVSIFFHDSSQTFETVLMTDEDGRKGSETRVCMYTLHVSIAGICISRKKRMYVNYNQWNDKDTNTNHCKMIL